MDSILSRQIKQAADWILASTDSGLPDFRGPEGVWTRRDKGLPPPRWGKPPSQIAPNASHLALVELYRLGKLAFLLASGFPAERLAELHGNGKLMRCLGCDTRYTLEQVGWNRRRWGEGYRSQRPKKGQPSCPHCSGRLISSVVNFGDPLPERELLLAFEHSLGNNLALPGLSD
jgi:NAD-dependent deacetylase